MSRSEQLEELVERLHLDQRSRWLSGQCVGAEWYLDRHPTLRSDADCLISLVYGEYCLRDDLADGPEPRDYLERFPQIADELGRLFDVDHELTGSGLAGVSGPSFPRRLNWPGKNKPLLLIDDRPDAIYPPASAAGRAALRPGYAFYSVAAEGESDESRCSGVDAYQPLGVLGAGSMGVVFTARRRNTTDTVAVKFITLGPYELSELAELFEAVRKASAVAHPALLAVHEASSWNELPYVVVERVEGPSLATLLTKGPLTPVSAVGVVSAVGKALAGLHAAQLVHGGVKPTNVLFAGDGAVRLSDAAIATKLPKAANFGCLLSEPPPGRTLQERMRQLARAVRRPANTALVRRDGGYLIGHPSYLAPELLAGRACEMSVAGDIYALGALWYAMLVGRPPFERRHWQATLDEASQGAIRSPSAANRTIPAFVDELVMTCLSRDPAHRPSATDLVEKLDAWLSQQPAEPLVLPAATVGNA